MTQHFDRFDEAVRSSAPYPTLRRVVQVLLEHGADRNELGRELEAFRVELRKQGRESDDDVVLDVLDDLTRWTSPHRKL